MNEVKHSLNKYRNLYRIKRRYENIGKWDIVFINKEYMCKVSEYGHKRYPYVYKNKPYKPYFLWRFWWTFLNIRKYTTKKFTINDTVKYIVVGVISTVIGTVIGYWILKCKLGWI